MLWAALDDVAALHANLVCSHSSSLTRRVPSLSLRTPAMRRRPRRFRGKVELGFPMQLERAAFGVFSHVTSVQIQT